MSIYLFTTPSANQEIDLPNSLYVELTSSLLARLKSVGAKAQELKDAGFVVYGIDILDWGVDASPLFAEWEGGVSNEDGNAFSGPTIPNMAEAFYPCSLFVGELPEVDDEGLPRIDGRGFRIDEVGFKLIAWAKWSDVKMSSQQITFASLDKALENAGVSL